MLNLKPNVCRRAVNIFFLAVILTGGKVDVSADAPSFVANKRSLPGPYCGVACLYAAMEFANKNINFSELVKPEYVGSREGSSLAELMQAATDNDLFTEAIDNFSNNALRSFNSPVILHVKASAEKNRYNHYILFLGDKNGKAFVFDPPNPPETIPYYRLAPIWSGTGLIVSAEPIDLAKILAPSRKRFAIFAGAVIAVIVLIRVAGRYFVGRIGKISRPVHMGFSFVQTGGLVAAALFFGVIYHFVNDAGFLAHAGATEAIVKANLGKFIPKVSAEDIEANAGTAVIIDARRTFDYDAGHIEGAINIPTTLRAEGLSEKLRDVEKSRRLVIYCQSAGCPYAEIVAGNLSEEGFSNLAIYKGGWVDWQERRKP